MNKQELFEKALNEFDEWPYIMVGMICAVRDRDNYKSGEFTSCHFNNDKYLDANDWTFVCTREEFEAAKAKCKPTASWDKAQENATHALTTGKDWRYNSDLAGTVIFVELIDGKYCETYDVDITYCIGDDSWVVLEARPEKPIYTKEMQERGELPSVGMMVNYQYGFNLFAGGEVRGVDNKMFWIKSDCGGFVTYTLSKLSPIDTRTDKEKAVDELMVELSKNNNNDEDRASIFAFYDKWVGDENEK